MKNILVTEVLQRIWGTPLKLSDSIDPLIFKGEFEALAGLDAFLIKYFVTILKKLADTGMSAVKVHCMSGQPAFHSGRKRIGTGAQ